MRRAQLFLCIGLFVFNTAGFAADMNCPPMPSEITKVARDVKSDVDLSVGKLGKVAAVDIATRTSVEAKSIFEKYPNVDKLVTLQMLSASYCSALNTSG